MYGLKSFWPRVSLCCRVSIETGRRLLKTLFPAADRSLLSASATTKVLAPLCARITNWNRFRLFSSWASNVLYRPSHIARILIPYSCALLNRNPRYSYTIATFVPVCPLWRQKLFLSKVSERSFIFGIVVYIWDHQRGKGISQCRYYYTVDGVGCRGQYKPARENNLAGVP